MRASCRTSAVVDRIADRHISPLRILEGAGLAWQRHLAILVCAPGLHFSWLAQGTPGSVDAAGFGLDGVGHRHLGGTDHLRRPYCPTATSSSGPSTPFQDRRKDHLVVQ